MAGPSECHEEETGMNVLRKPSRRGGRHSACRVSGTPRGEREDLTQRLPDLAPHPDVHGTPRSLCLSTFSLEGMLATSVFVI